MKELKLDPLGWQLKYSRTGVKMQFGRSKNLSCTISGSRETSPHRVRNTSRYITSSLETSPATSHSASPLPPDTDGEEEEFKDTVEVIMQAPNKSHSRLCTFLIQMQTPQGKAALGLMTARNSISKLEHFLCTGETETTEKMKATLRVFQTILFCENCFVIEINFVICY